MGFLNHATNNIIVDAVLTDKGRELLSRNDGSFKITKFKLADDEVDYSIVEQYGIALGKEKIEKNTPIFEAITNQNLAIKYPLITLSNDTTKVYAYPSIVLDETNETINVSTQTTSAQSYLTPRIRIKTSINQDESFDLNSAKLVDDYFKVRVFNKLLKVTNAEGILDVTDDITTYAVKASQLQNSSDFNGQTSAEISITATGITTDSSFSQYSLSQDKTLIKTQIEVIGNRTNSVKTIPVHITSNKLS